MSSITDQLRDWAQRQPETRALTVVGAHGETTLSAAELAERVRSLAARLASRFAPGERALLLLDNDEHYVCAFLACLDAGLIAVPAFPPESNRDQHQARLAAIAADCAPAAVLSTRELIERHRADDCLAGVAALVAVDAPSGTDSAPAADFAPVPALADTVAFLQYTSGSTAAPKGVMVTHGNLIANAIAIATAMGIGEGDRMASWLPLYHDMGLIGGLLQPLYRQIPLVLMSPAWFLERPIRWLEAISRHRATVSGGPDFAYRLCLERVRDGQLDGLELSSWRVAFSGAEPVRADTLAAFGARFAAAGFDASALYPCYGLAEATLLVSGGLRGAGVQGGEGSSPVACGAVQAAHALAIVDAEGRLLPDGQVGNIEFAGPSVAAGYWRREEATRETFVEARGRRWLRTGDLGFLRDGGLYITGRRKDLVIVRGHNLYPQDLELAVERRVEAVRPGRVAAFAVPAAMGGLCGEGSSEGIGIAVEISRSQRKRVEPARLVDAIARAIAEHCREPLAVCVLLEPGALPKTSSGKLQRSACREGWLHRTLAAYAIFEHGRCVHGEGGALVDEGREPPHEALAEAVTASLACHWRELLGRAPRADADFFVDGGNSLSAVQLAVRLADELGLAEPPQGLVFENPRFDVLAAALRALPAGRPATSLVRLPRDGALPLSAAQRRQFFLWQLAREHCAAHVGGVLHLRGEVGTELLGRLQEALDATIERHEALRCHFRLDDGGRPSAVPFAALAKDEASGAHVRLIHVDLHGLSSELAARRADEESARLHAAPFDLEHGSLLRAALITGPVVAGSKGARLAITVHHIAADGPSMQLLLDEFGARLGGTALDPLAFQYADVTAHQEAALGAGRRARDLAYWRGRLGVGHGEEPALTRLAFDRPHPGAGDCKQGPRDGPGGLPAARVDLELGAKRLAALRELVAALGCGLPALLLAAWQALLHRHLGQREVRIGVPTTVRDHRAAEPLIGLFVNTLVLKSDIAPGMTLLALALQCRASLVDAQAHAALPFDELVDALRPERSLGVNPLVQLSFNHLEEDYRAFERGCGLPLAHAEFIQREVFYELTLETRLQRSTSGERLSAAFVYAAPLFESATIMALARHWLAFLDALIEDAAQRIDAVSLGDNLPVSGVVPAGGGFVHERFARVAAERPGAPALIDGAVPITYAELDRRARRVAHALIERCGKVGEWRIGLLLNRSADAIVAMLAVLKAGAAYVPLDPAYPAERLAGMVHDARLTLLIADGDAGVAPRAGDVALVPLVLLAELEQAGRSDWVPKRALHAEQLAYLIFTSGSTGRPKGVAVAHGALAMHMAAIAPVYGLDAEQRELMFFSLSFDAAIEQWLGPLLAGGTLVLGTAEQLAPAAFAALVEAQRINALHLPPAYLRLLAPLLRPGQVRRCYVGGEAFAGDDLAAVRAALGPGARVVNAYGPTETVITPTAWVDDGAEMHASQVPIGRPVGARHVHVLDAELRPVPQGAVGELWIAGAGLARGYFGRPGATAERFIADPLQAEAPGGRLYRSGDLVRWRCDTRGELQLEYLGRADGQVKVRGYRIELGEIESALRALAGVADAAALADGQRLLAFVAPRPEARPDPAELRQALRARLPDHMLPARIRVLDALPLTPNGKLDRAALARLPQPELEAGAQAPTLQMPADTLQATLAALWARVLKLPAVGPHDNFFDLGGHSLLLIELHQALLARPEPGLASLQLVDLYRHPTVAELAKQLARGPHAEAPAGATDAIAARAARQRTHLTARAAARTRP